MKGYLGFLGLALLFYKVHSQLCSPPILPPPCPAPCVPFPCDPIIPPCPISSPQVINPNPYVTTIIDNSVSNALVNALQLLIVSNLIGSTINPSTPMINNLGPLLESIVCPNPCPVEVVIPEYITYGPNYYPTCAPITTCGPYYDIIPPYGSNCAPVPNCGPYYDFVPPYNPYCSPCEYMPSCSPIIDTLSPPLCGLTDILCPNYFAYTETVSPIYSCINPFPCNGYGDAISPIYGYETIGPYCGGLTEIIPNYLNYPVNEVCPSMFPYYGGFVETVTPTVATLPNMVGCLNEVVAPCISLPNVYPPEIPFRSLVSPNCYGCLGDLPVEVLLPSAFPAQLNCNFGYTPSSLPCVRVNVEPLPYDNCLCNGYGPIYY